MANNDILFNESGKISSRVTAIEGWGVTTPPGMQSIPNGSPLTAEQSLLTPISNTVEQSLPTPLPETEQSLQNNEGQSPINN